MRKVAKVVLGGVVGAVAGVVTIPFYTFLDSVAPFSYPIVGTVCGTMIGTEFKQPAVGGAVGAIVGAAMIPLSGVNAACRPWAQPVFGAITGGLVASQMED